jgi:hypothetical protein
MPNFRLTTPKILWGAALANTLRLGYPLDNVTSGDTPRDGSSWAQTPSGVEDAWIVGTDYVLSGDVRWIPQTDTSSPLATGWDGATGFRAFLAWARAKNVIRFYPDAGAGTFVDSYLVDPLQGEPLWESDGTRRITLRIRNVSTAYDGY